MTYNVLRIYELDSLSLIEGDVIYLNKINVTSAIDRVLKLHSLSCEVISAGDALFDSAKGMALVIQN